MSRQVISAKGISKVFNNQNSSLEVLKEISFDLDRGQSIGIVGASGSGKTTLLQHGRRLKCKRMGSQEFVPYLIGLLFPDV